jgi:UDP-glucose 4-epimerase
MMKWLITGGCGFIGTSLIRELVAEGVHTVRVLDNLTVGTRGDLSEITTFRETPPGDTSPMTNMFEQGSVELIQGDIRDGALCLRVAEGADVIVHLAASTGVEPSVLEPRFDCDTNVLGTLNMLEAARHGGAGRFVFASSGAPIGECRPPIHEEMPAHPVSPYGASKLAGEGYCSAYFRSFGVETVALRFGNVYGPGSGHKSSVVAKFIRRAMKGEKLEIYGNGRQTRDFIFIGDLVRAARLAATRPGVGGEVFQIATNAETTVGELVDILVPLLRHAGFDGVEVIHGEARTGDVMRNFSDTSKAAAKLGWKSEVDLPAGLGRTVRWFVERAERQSAAA